jgi:hypothetical protein
MEEPKKDSFPLPLKSRLGFLTTLGIETTAPTSFTYIGLPSTSAPSYSLTALAADAVVENVTSAVPSDLAF